MSGAARPNTAYRQRELERPSLNTVKARQLELAPHHVHRRRLGLSAARTLEPVVGEPMPARLSLDATQMNISPADSKDVGGEVAQSPSLRDVRNLDARL